MSESHEGFWWRRRNNLWVRPGGESATHHGTAPWKACLVRPLVRPRLWALVAYFRPNQWALRSSQAEDAMRPSGDSQGFRCPRSHSGFPPGKPNLHLAFAGHPRFVKDGVSSELERYGEVVCLVFGGHPQGLPEVWGGDGASYGGAASGNASCAGDSGSVCAGSAVGAGVEQVA